MAVELEIEKLIEKRMRDLERSLKEYVNNKEYALELSYTVRYKNIVDNTTNKPITVIDYVEIEIEIFTRFMEISEFCSNAVNEVIEDECGDDLDDDQEMCNKVDEKLLEDLFDECMENELESINTEYALYNDVKYRDQDMEITTEPIECDQDYCHVGGVINVTLYNVSDYGLNKLERVLYRVIDLLLM